MRSTSRQPLQSADQEILRALLEAKSAVQVAAQLGVEHGLVARAASGARLLRGSRLVIETALATLRRRGELPRVGGDAA